MRSWLRLGQSFCWLGWGWLWFPKGLFLKQVQEALQLVVGGEGGMDGWTRASGPSGDWDHPCVCHREEHLFSLPQARHCWVQGSPLATLELHWGRTGTWREQLALAPNQWHCPWACKVRARSLKTEW